ncbi:MAG: EamA family transporter [Cocleimonas sp.]|nr:EamA family transporter [Cocleimonas sp.]
MQDSRQQSNTISGILYALSGTALFSIKPIIIKLAYQSGSEELEAITLLTLRMLFTLPFYLLIGWLMLKRNKSTKNNINARLLLGISATGFCGYYLAAYLDIWGLQYISAQLERMTLFVYPTIVALLSFILFKQRITLNMVLATLLTYAGIAAMYYQESLLTTEHVAKGMSLIALAALSFAFYMVFSKGYIQKIGSRLFTSIAMLASSVFIFIHFLISQPLESLILSTELYLIIAIIAIPCTVVPSFLISEAIARIGPSKTSIANGSGPMITLIAAISILGEPFSMIYLLGMGLIITGIYLLSRQS